jgi:hypothetical protein
VGVYVSFGEESEPTTLASNNGWSEFGDWVDELDVKEYGELIHLYDHGWSQHAGEIARQLRKAVEGELSSDSVKSTANDLLSLLKDVPSDEVITISDGLSPVGGE